MVQCAHAILYYVDLAFPEENIVLKIENMILYIPPLPQARLLKYPLHRRAIDNSLLRHKASKIRNVSDQM